mgnify:CR=1 FL=1
MMLIAELDERFGRRHQGEEDPAVGGRYQVESYLDYHAGKLLARPPRGLVTALEARDIGMEAMDSRAAARAWGVLRSEGRQIAAALYPIDYTA